MWGIRVKRGTRSGGVKRRFGHRGGDRGSAGTGHRKGKRDSGGQERVFSTTLGKNFGKRGDKNKGGKEDGSQKFL